MGQRKASLRPTQSMAEIVAKRLVDDQVDSTSQALGHLREQDFLATYIKTYS